VKGTNPSPEAVDLPGSQRALSLWYASHSWGYPCGLGIGQIDPPQNPSVVWNWQANVTAAISKMIAFESTARTPWSQAEGAHNGSGVNLPLCPLVVSNGSGQVVEYRLTVPVTPPPPVGSAKPWVRPYSDGSALKFNALGYGDGPYMSWDNTTHTWEYHPWSHDSKPKYLPPGTAMPPLYAHEYPVEFFREEP